MLIVRPLSESPNNSCFEQKEIYHLAPEEEKKVAPSSSSLTAADIPVQ